VEPGWHSQARSRPGGSTHLRAVHGRCLHHRYRPRTQPRRDSLTTGRQMGPADRKPERRSGGARPGSRHLSPGRSSAAVAASRTRSSHPGTPVSAARPIIMPRQPAPRDTGDSIGLGQRTNPIPPAWKRHSARATSSGGRAAPQSEQDPLRLLATGQHAGRARPGFRWQAVAGDQAVEGGSGAGQHQQLAQ
jgi:hypothetical protein